MRQLEPRTPILSPGTCVMIYAAIPVILSLTCASVPGDGNKTEARDHKSLQHEIVERTNSIGMKLVKIPAGEFTMGCPLSSEQLAARFRVEPWVAGISLPTRPVRIPADFQIGKYEVTVGEFGQFVRDTGHRTDAEKSGRASGIDPQSGEFVWGDDFSWKHPGWEQNDNHPVVNVSWNDAIAFCE